MAYGVAVCTRRCYRLTSFPLVVVLAILRQEHGFQAASQAMNDCASPWQHWHSPFITHARGWYAYLLAIVMRKLKFRVWLLADSC